MVEGIHSDISDNLKIYLILLLTGISPKRGSEWSRACVDYIRRLLYQQEVTVRVDSHAGDTLNVTMDLNHGGGDVVSVQQHLINQGKASSSGPPV